MTAGRIRRAWAVLRGRDDPATVTVDTATGEPVPPGAQGRILTGVEALNAARSKAEELRDLRAVKADQAALIASLRASLDDANAVIARLSAEAKARNDLTRQAHALLGRAITDDGVPQP